MKTASKTTYQNLTTAQRFRAAIAARARADDAEFKKLVSYSPDGEYVINKLSARVNDFTTAAFCIRIDLLACLSEWLLFHIILSGDPTEPKSYLSSMKRVFQKCDSIITARNRWLESLGIPLETFEAYDGPIEAIQQSLLKELITRSDGHADPDETEGFYQALSDWFKSRHPASCS